MTRLCPVCAVIAALVLAVLLACGGRPEHKYVYEMRVLVEAKYGHGVDEFGREDLVGCLECEPSVVICLDVDSAGSVYIYDGRKEDIKVYDQNGVYQRTVKALPPGEFRQNAANMSVGPTGTIYFMVIGQATQLYSISSDGSQLTGLPFVLGAGMATKDAIPSYLGVEWLTADMRGDVYVGDVWVSDSRPVRSMRVVKSGKAVAAGDQLASLRPGRPSKWGPWVVDDSLGMTRPSTRGISVYGSDGSLKPRLIRLSGRIWGTDSGGNVFEETAVSRADSGRVSCLNVISPRGVLDARIELPRIPESVQVFGKDRMTGLDGSVYVVSGEDDRLRVYKWERKRATSRR